MNSRYGTLLVLIGSAMFGFMGIFTRGLEGSGLRAISIAFFRIMVSIVLIGLVMLFIDRKLFRIKREHILFFFLLGYCKATMDYSLIVSQNLLTLGFSTSLQMTAPFFVIVLTYLIYREKITSPSVIGTLVCILGTVLYSGVFFDSIPIDMHGVFCGLMCGLSTAGFVLLTKELLNKDYNPMTVTFYALLIALLIISIFVDIPTSFSIAANSSVLVNIILLGIFCTAIPYVLLAYGQKWLDNLKVTIYSTFEIVAAAIIGWIFFQESLDFTEMIGLVLVIASIVIITKFGKRERSTDPT